MLCDMLSPFSKKSTQVPLHCEAIYPHSPLAKIPRNPCSMLPHAFEVCVLPIQELTVHEPYSLTEGYCSAWWWYHMTSVRYSLCAIRHFLLGEHDPSLHRWIALITFMHGIMTKLTLLERQLLLSTTMSMILQWQPRRAKFCRERELPKLAWPKNEPEEARWQTPIAEKDPESLGKELSEILLLSSTASMAEYAEPRLIRSKMEIELPHEQSFLLTKSFELAFAHDIHRLTYADKV